MNGIVVQKTTMQTFLIIQQSQSLEYNTKTKTESNFFNFLYHPEDYKRIVMFTVNLNILGGKLVVKAWLRTLSKRLEA